MTDLPEASPLLEVRIQAGGATLAGDLGIPAGATGIVVFAHGSGSGRRSPRNRAVARALRETGLATLLFDLLTEGEDEEDRRTARLRFDIPFLAARLAGILTWLARDPDTRGLQAGLFGSSTGGAAALVAAAGHPGQVHAVVSRGGRPDLAGDALPLVRAPTLLVVGGADAQVLTLNRDAMARMRCEVRLEVVPDATHLFEEPGALEMVAALAADWYRGRLVPRRAATPPRP